MDTGNRIIRYVAAAGLCLLCLAMAGCQWIKSKEAESYASELGKQVESAANEVGEAMESMVAEVQEDYGNEASASSWASPLPGGSITQQFGADNDDEGGCHLGLDISDSEGAAVCAMYDGTVIESDTKGSNGEIVVIRHSLGACTFYSAYCHLQSGSRAVGKGERVSAGQQVGIVGDTGNVTGIHLHLAVYSGRASRDPYGYLDTNYDGRGYIDYPDQWGTLRFYDPESVLADNGQTVINNYPG